eukprot:TRINITY_DN6400_c0_g1_i2.p1 TRINITY_DN6400_c0_g1~~TRINITY_DN6400_c0_g1_i2.p1  ORF type:complete len:906 (+),score=135.93 TRINITY_DN6400_c0_g1_i2:187-2904(+)
MKSRRDLASVADFRRELLLAAPSVAPFRHVATSYDNAAEYFSAMADNVKAELTAAFAQGIRGVGPLLTFRGDLDVWVLEGGGNEPCRSLKSSIIQDIATKEVFWVSSSKSVDMNTDGEAVPSQHFTLDGFDSDGKKETLTKQSRKVRVTMFAADYAARYLAARIGANDTVNPDLMTMVLSPGSARTGSYALAAAGVSAQLNESQRNAVLGLQRRLEVIHGPPGTGKSTTIFGLLQSRVPSGRTSCVSCVTNQALEAVSCKLQHSHEELPFVVLGTLENLGEVASRFRLEEQAMHEKSVIEAQSAWVELRNAIAEAEKERLSQCSTVHEQLWARKLKELKAQKDTRQNDLETAIEKAKNHIVQRTRVFLCTIASLYRISSLQKDYVDFFPGAPHTIVIDEAAATPESYVPQVLHTRAENLVLLGDHLQLPPLVITQDLADLDRKQGNRSLMERALDRMPQHWLHQLTEQYRMPQGLCKLVSDLFYEGRLVTGPSRALGSLSSASAPLRWLVVEQRETTVGTSKVNIAEAALIVEWLDREVPLAKVRGETVKCITFYKSQRNLLRACFDQDPEIAAMVVSVDASQGSESNHILVSTVRSNDKADVGFCADPRRLCVALSRAKSTLTVIGDPRCMSFGKWQKVHEAAEKIHAPVMPETVAKVERKFGEMRVKPCRYFQLGRCTQGADCTYSHEFKPGDKNVSAQIHVNLKPCQFYAQGCCTQGAKCTYSHDFKPGNKKVAAQIRVKAEPCQFYAQGRCTQGAGCTYSHDFKPGDKKVAAQIRVKAEPCQFYAQGRCTQGAGCTYSHDFKPGDKKVAAQIRVKAEPCQFYAQGRCTQGAGCTYSHDFKPGDKKVAAQIRVNAELCQFFARGKCTKGSSCTFSHDSGLTPKSGKRKLVNDATQRQHKRRP